MNNQYIIYLTGVCKIKSRCLHLKAMYKPTSSEQIISNILYFQSKKHPAWDTTEPFSKRIHNLPLYFLEFNHHERDQETQSVTVTHYVPCRSEMMALAEIIKSFQLIPEVFMVVFSPEDPTIPKSGLYVVVS